MPRLLLCPPDYYGIEYEINPWMRRTIKADLQGAQSQWEGLHSVLKKLGCEVNLVQPEPRLPDMVFTANAGLIFGNKAVLSNFRFAERQGEADHFRRWFHDHGHEVVVLPETMIFEGEGDALFSRDALVCGYRFRSDIQAHQKLGAIIGRLVLSVELVDPRFYHVDTCFCPLPDGGAMWFPGAFDPYGQRVIRSHCDPLIEVPEDEARHFACNAVVIGRNVVLPAGCPATIGRLQERGYTCHDLPMSEFIKAGGACKCLTLFLDHN
jgi:N-dimethylarginine dimethylaminohydrolase